MSTPDYSGLLDKARGAFNSGKTRTYEWRHKQLLAFVRMLDEKKDALCEALYKDLRKHRSECDLTEISYIKNDAIDTINNLRSWMKPKKVKKNIMTMTDDAFINYEPYGVALVIGAWNYPVMVTLGPVIGAIAAGNCAIVKPSELAPATAEVMAAGVREYLDNEAIQVVMGGVDETTALLQQHFDFICYTGNSQVGKIIASAAAKNLTPTLLELGGKSPCYVHPDSDMDLAARRIMWGKFVNSGQTCIAPDYVLCNKQVQDQLVQRIEANLTKFYGDNPQDSDSLGRVINNRHFNRIKGLMGAGRCVIGGKTDEKDLFIEPTVVVDVRASDPIMQQEIFGPVLPILSVADEEEAIAFINANEKPLAMYVFAKNGSIVKKMISRTSSGGFCGNDTLMHNAMTTLPFGGVGNSGMGHYHGRFSFVAFSHERSCLLRSQNMEMLNDVRYPPYTARKYAIANWALGKKIKSGSSVFSLIPIIIIGIMLGFIIRNLC